MQTSKTTPILLMAVIALGAGFVGLLAFDSGPSNYVPLAVGGMMGHLTIIHADADGNIKGYQQTDNFIIASGEDCTAKLLFFGTAASFANSTGLCPQNLGGDSNNNNFNAIALLSGGSCGAGLTADDVDLNDGACTLVTTPGLVPVRITLTDAEIETSSEVTVGQVLVELDNIFTAGGSITVVAAAITNSTSTTDTVHAVLAKTDFASDVALNSADTLTLNWDFEIGGTTTLSGG